jgi:hypothetical protein
MAAWRKANSPADFKFEADKIDQVLQSHGLIGGRTRTRTLDPLISWSTCPERRLLQ